MLQMDMESLSSPVPPLAPHPTNMRVPCENIANMAASSAPIFGVEQEYVVQEPPVEAESPGGCWPHAHLPDPTKPFLYGPNGEDSSTIGRLRSGNACRALRGAHSDLNLS